MNYSYGTNADQYLNKEGLDYLIKQLDLKYSDSGTVDLTNYYDKTEIDNLLSNIDGTIGNDGVGIQSVELVNYELIVTLTDATVINLGNVRGEQGIQGQDGVKGDTGAKGEQGIQGDKGLDGKDGVDGVDGVSPTITVATNTDTVYSLSITDTNGTITTPNLKGQDGADGEGGSGGGSSDTYSTDEIAIGTWIDGKTIYRKVYTGNILKVTSGNSLTETIPHDVANIGQIIKIGIIVNVNALVYTGNGIMINGCTNTTLADIEKSTIWMIADLTSIYFVHGSNWGANRPYKIIFEYTKTV